MSSTTLIEKVGSSLSKFAGAGWSIFRLGSSPIGATARGAVEVGRWLIYTTFGRAAIVLVLLLCTFSYFKHHFTALEAMKWQTAVASKQQEIVKKVATVNSETRQAQAIARSEVGAWDKILAVVTQGIWKVEKPDPVEAETVDLINETRGRSKK